MSKAISRQVIGFVASVAVATAAMASPFIRGVLKAAVLLVDQADTEEVASKSVEEEIPSSLSLEKGNQVMVGSDQGVQINGSPGAQVGTFEGTRNTFQGDQFEGSQNNVQGDLVEGDQTNIQDDLVQGDQVFCGDGGTAYNCAGEQTNDFRGSSFDNSVR